MFNIKAEVMSSQRGHFEQALSHLDQAHMEAQRVGVNQLHAAVVNAADREGLPTEGIVQAWHKGHGYVGIADTPAGDALADIEFGRPGEVVGEDDAAPSPVLRNAHAKAFPHANHSYARTLLHRSGLA